MAASNPDVTRLGIRLANRFVGVSGKVLGEQLDFVRIVGGEVGSGVFLLFFYVMTYRCTLSHLCAPLGMYTKFCDV